MTSCSSHSPSPQSASKKRPAVVVSSGAYNRSHLDLILMAVTSQVRPVSTTGEMRIGRWKQAGLIKASVVKPVIMTIDRPLVLRRLGRLLAQDRANLQRTLDEVLQP